MTKPEEIVTYSTEELKQLVATGKDQTDWSRVRMMPDEAIRYDDDAPPLSEAMFLEADVRQTQTEVNLLIDTTVLEWYIKHNVAYQKLINQLLRSYMEAHQESR